MEATQALFDRILWGIDGTPQSLAAVAQAERLLAPGGKAPARRGRRRVGRRSRRRAAARVLDEIESGAHDAAARAAERASDTDSRVLEGEPARCLLDVIDVSLRRCSRWAATAMAARRASSSATPPPRFCTRLVRGARRPPGAERKRVSLGGRRSSGACSAGAGRGPSGRRALLSPTESGRGERRQGGPPGGLRGVPDLEWDERRPVDALVAASQTTDLIVVGSRGLHGPAALGSLSERVAHRARSSVLTVRGG